MSFRRSLILSFAQKHSLIVIRILAMIIVSRLVPPDQFGIFLLAQAIVTLGMMFADFGVQQYIVSAPERSIDYERRALGAALITTTAALSVMVLATYLAPTNMLDTRVRVSIFVLGLASILIPFTSVSKAVMQRDMRYGELYWISVLGAFIGAAFTVAAAWRGLGYMSPVGGAAMEIFVMSLVAMSRHCPARPTFRGLRHTLSFGGMITSLSGVKQAGDTAVPLQVEAALGFAAVGVLGRAQGILLMFDRLIVDALSHVLLPALAERRRSGIELTTLQTRMTTYLTAFAWPFFALLAWCAPQVIEVLLGSQWSGAVQPLRILCLGGMLLPFHALLLPYLLALGIADRFLPWQAVIQVGKLLLVVPAAWISVECVCAVLVLERLATAVIGQRLLNAAMTPVPATDWRGVAISGVATVASVVAAGTAIELLTISRTPIMAPLISIGVAMPVWLVAMLLLRHPLRDEIGRTTVLAREAIASRLR